MLDVYQYIKAFSSLTKKNATVVGISGAYHTEILNPAAKSWSGESNRIWWTRLVFFIFAVS